MRSKFPVLISLVLFSTVVSVGRTTRAQFAELTKYIPGSANTIIVFNAEKIFNSPVAQREGWRRNYQKALDAGMVRLPMDTRRYIAASQMDFATMQPAWEIGVLVTDRPHAMIEVVRKRKGIKTTVAGHEAVILPTGEYIVQFDAHTYGSMAPGNRQAVARWIQNVEKRSRLSPYIQEAIGYADDAGTEIIMAMDLQDVIGPDVAKTALAKMECVTKAKADVDQLARLMASLRGATLGITFRDKPYGKLKADFGRDASALNNIIKPLFLQVLTNQSVMIEDLESWEARVSGKQATLAGFFSTSGMRRVLSLIDPPVSGSIKDTEAAQASASDVDPKMVASRQYFHSITTLLDEFRHRDSPQRIAQIGGWLDKYARRVDRLPMVNVDNELLDFGGYVSQQLRNAGAAIQGIGIRSRVRQVEAANSDAGYYGNNYDGGYYHGGYYYRGGYGTGVRDIQAGNRAQFRARTQVRVREKASGTSAARAIMKDLENASAQMRRKMTEKYEVEFK